MKEHFTRSRIVSWTYCLGTHQDADLPHTQVSVDGGYGMGWNKGTGRKRDPLEGEAPIWLKMLILIPGWGRFEAGMGRGCGPRLEAGS